MMPAASSSFFTTRKCRPCCFAGAKSEMYPGYGLLTVARVLPGGARIARVAKA
jgi:hypothetical protein